jgi:rifampicin phosphotransferase
LKEAAALKEAVEKELGKLLLARGKPTAAGRALLKELHASDALASDAKWIARSSFTAEDRPNKSSAGQFESFPNLATDAARLRGIAGVIASMWKATPVENNLQMGIDLREVFPSVLMQRCLKPTVSGVAVSRGAKGELGEVSYQAVRGFGGGVGGGKAEEGVVKKDGATGKDSLLTPKQAALLREAVLAIEREFHEVIEPGKGYAVDVEWAIEDGKLHIVQARVIVDE